MAIRSVNPFRHPDATVRCAFVVAAVAVALGIVFIEDAPFDVCMWYARLAREFGEHRWEFAFFPETPPLVPVLAGIPALAGIEAYTALKMVAGVGYLTTLWMVRRMSLRFGPKVSAASVWLALAVPLMLRHTGKGLTGPVKMALLTGAVWVLTEYCRRPRLRLCPVLGGCLGLLCLTRIEGQFLAALILGVFVAGGSAGVFRAPTSDRPGRLASFAGHLAALAATMLVVCLPWLLYVRAQSGLTAFTPESREFVERVVLRRPVEKANTLSAEMRDYVVGSRPRRNFSFTAEDVSEGVRGLSPLVLLLALAGWRRGRRNGMLAARDSIPVLVVAANFVLFAVSGNVLRRYTVWTVPLLLPYAAIGLRACVTRAGCRFGWRVVTPVLATVWAVFLLDGLLEVRSALGEKDENRVVGEWIASRGEELTRSPAVLAPIPRVPPRRYFSGRKPIVAADSPEGAYWGWGDFVLVPEQLIYSYDGLVNYLRFRSVDVLEWTSDFAESCPEFDDRAHEDFVLVKSFEPDIDARLYLFRPVGTGGGEGPRREGDQ